jgi:hypothetical protein
LKKSFLTVLFLSIRIKCESPAGITISVRGYLRRKGE